MVLRQDPHKPRARVTPDRIGIRAVEEKVFYSFNLLIIEGTEGVFGNISLGQIFYSGESILADPLEKNLDFGRDLKMQMQFHSLHEDLVLCRDSIPCRNEGSSSNNGEDQGYLG